MSMLCNECTKTTQHSAKVKRVVELSFHKFNWLEVLDNYSHTEFLKKCKKPFYFGLLLILFIRNKYFSV